MLQPKNYPHMIGKALVLEGEPFITMTDDDDPWMEGLFLVITLGAFVALSQFIGALLLTISLPPSNVLLEAVIQGWRMFAGAIGFAAGGAVEATLRQQWDILATIAGFGGGWSRLLIFVFVPSALLFQWLLYGLVGHGMARMLGGNASLNQTLGATALLTAPNALLLLQVVPFVSVSGLLIGVWSLLIVYRALEIAHELPWKRAMSAALLTPVLVMLITAATISATALVLAWVGG